MPIFSMKIAYSYNLNILNYYHFLQQTVAQIKSFKGLIVTENQEPKLFCGSWWGPRTNSFDEFLIGVDSASLSEPLMGHIYLNGNAVGGA